MVYIRINETTDKLVDKYKNLWVVHGLNEVLRPYKMVFEKSQIYLINYLSFYYKSDQWETMFLNNEKFKNTKTMKSTCEYLSLYNSV